MKRKITFVIIVLIGIAAVIIGLKSGDLEKIYSFAKMICLDCIGLM